MTDRFPGVDRNWMYAEVPKRPLPMSKMVRENFVAEVQKNALLYVFNGSTIARYMAVFDSEMIAKAGRLDPNFSVSGRYMIEQPLPPGLDLWKHWLLTIPEEERDLEPYICRKRLWPGGYGHLAPDVITAINFPLVRSNVREVLLDTDPDGHYFVPAEFVDWDSGEPIPGEWWHWLVRRRFSVSTEGPEWSKSLPFGGGFGSDRAANEFVKNSSARSFFDEIPVFGDLLTYYEVAFNRDLFAKLKAAGVTGLVERTNDAPGAYVEDQKDHENVGHIP